MNIKIYSFISFNLLYRTRRMKKIYYDEGQRGTNKFTFTVFSVDSGFEVVARSYRLLKNGTQEITFEKKWQAADKNALRCLDYKGSQRLADVFLESQFWIS